MKIMPEKIAITVFGKEKDTFAKEMKLMSFGIMIRLHMTFAYLSNGLENHDWLTSDLSFFSFYPMWP